MKLFNDASHGYHRFCNQVDWNANFEGPVQADYPQPYYIDEFKVGIIAAHVQLDLSRGSYYCAVLRTFTCIHILPFLIVYHFTISFD